MKTRLLRLLGKLRLLRPLYRAYEGGKALKPARRPGAGDGLPLPPPKLRVLVAGTPDAGWFLESGRLAVESIASVLARNGRRVEELASILDFGCGCGRVIRRWRSLDAALAGSDVNARLIEWCRQNLPFARFEVNGLAPPLAFNDSAFELVYGLSVLTHLPEDLQAAWMGELARVLRPDGLLVLTTHGERYLERLTPAERHRFRGGECIVRFEEVAGTNLCTAFHPPVYVRERLADGFEVLTFVPEGARGNPHQDLFLLRKR